MACGSGFCMALTAHGELMAGRPKSARERSTRPELVGFSVFARALVGSKGFWISVFARAFFGGSGDSVFFGVFGFCARACWFHGFWFWVFVHACWLVPRVFGFLVFAHACWLVFPLGFRFSRARVSRWVLVFGFRVRVLVAHYSDRCVVFAREFFGRLAPRGERVTSEC